MCTGSSTRPITVTLPAASKLGGTATGLDEGPSVEERGVTIVTSLRTGEVAIGILPNGRIIEIFPCHRLK